MAKLELKDILSAVDQGGRDIWDLLDEEQKKSVSFFLLNRYVSSVKTKDPEKQEHFIMATNEYFNKHWKLFNKHPKLLWQLLCLCAHESKQEFFHEWIGYKKKQGNGQKKQKFLEQVFPNHKLADIELMASMNSLQDLKEYAVELGWSDQKINEFFK